MKKGHAVLIVSCIVVLYIFLTIGRSKRSSRESPHTSTVVAPNTDGATGNRQRGSSHIEHEPNVTSQGNTDEVKDLRQRLQIYKTWRVDANERRRLLLAKIGDYKVTPREAAEWKRELEREAAEWKRELQRALLGLRELMIKDPRALIEFVADQNNAACVPDLLAYTLLEEREGHGLQRRDYSSFPSDLMMGLLDLCTRVPELAQQELLRFLEHIDQQPQQALLTYRALLRPEGSLVNAQAARLLCSHPNVQPEDLEALRALIEHPSQLGWRQNLILSYSTANSKDAGAWLCRKLSESGDEEFSRSLVQGLITRASCGLESVEGFEHWSKSFDAVLKGSSSPKLQWSILEATVYLPAEHLLASLERIRAGSSKDLQAMIAQIKQLYDSGVKNPTVLRLIISEGAEQARRRDWR